MANAAPCQACLEVPDAEFCVTNRLGVPWPFEQAVINLCVPCFINLGITIGTALQEAIAAVEAEAQAGVLEQVEADEGKVRPAKSGTKSRPRKKATATLTVVGPEATPQTEATDEQQ